MSYAWFYIIFLIQDEPSDILYKSDSIFNEHMEFKEKYSKNKLNY